MSDGSGLPRIIGPIIHWGSSRRGGPIAYTPAPSSHAEAVEQIEILFALAIGALVFGERQRLGAGVMLAGMILLSLAGVR